MSVSGETPRRGARTNILIVEDSPTQATRLQAILEDRGHATMIARNGREGLALASQDPPTLAISDVVMPEMDGYEFCRRMKQDHVLKRVPVLLLTSLSDPTDVVRGLECGADNFLVKPYDPDYLVSRVEYMLANRHIRETDSAQMGLEILFAGQKYFITSDRLQILNLLLSTYETAVHKNRQLLEVQEDLRNLNESLDEKVRERTAQLQGEVEERRRVEAELQRGIARERKLAEQLQQAQKMEAIGRLTSGVAHDFNNLLNVILLSAELLEIAPTKDESLIQDIVAAGHRGAGLTRQLLTFSRKAVISPEPVHVNVVLRQMQKLLGRMIGEDIELTLKEDPTVGHVMVDPSQFEQVMMNLAVNARDAMPSGGRLMFETARITVDEAFIESHMDFQLGEYVLVAVSDNGHGMAQETKERIFEPFFTTKALGKGTGLGLATTYGIVKQTGGTISVYSELGIGTTFRIYLPMLAKGTAEAQQQKTAGQQTPVGDETILLVEDENGLRRICRAVLESYGYRVIEASDGNVGLELAAQHVGRIHLLLSDVVVPNLGGSRLAAKLLEARPDTKVLFMSGYTDDAIIRHGLVMGELELLQKPFTPAMLARRVRAVLDGDKD